MAYLCCFLLARFDAKMNFKSLSRKVTSALGYHDEMDPFIRDVFPLLMLYRAMGRCPFRTNKHGHIEVKLFTINGLYWAFAYGFITFLFVDAYCEDDVMSYFREDKFSATVVGFSGIQIGVLHFAASLALITRWGPVIDYFEEWVKLNANFKKHMGTRKHSSLQMLSILIAFALLVGSFAVMMPLKSILFGRYWYHTGLAPMGFVSSSTEILVFSSCCAELTNMSLQINSKLKSLLNNDRAQAQELYALRLLWLELAHLARKTGSCISLPLFLELGSTTAYFSFSAFGGISCLVTGKEDVLQYFAVFLATAIRLLIFFESGQQTSQHVGKKIIETLSTADVLNMDYRAMEEVVIFIQTIKSNSPTINIAGLMRVSRKQMSLLVKEALFYVLIMLQIQVTPKNK